MSVYIVYNASTSPESRTKAKKALDEHGVSYMELSARVAPKLLSEPEVFELHKLYRRNYERKQNIKEKRLEYNNRPDVMKRRREYSKKPEVIQRKQAQAKRRNEIIRRIRVEEPLIYQRLISSNETHDSSLNNASTEETQTH